MGKDFKDTIVGPFKDPIGALDPLYIWKNHTPKSAEEIAKEAQDKYEQSPEYLGLQSIAAQKLIAPIQYELEKQYRPQYTTLDNEIAWQSTLGDKGSVALQGETAKKMSEFQQLANTSQRSADLADLQSLGSKYSEAIRGANPDLYKAQGRLSDMIDSAAGAGTPQVGQYQMGASRLERSMEADAASGLNRVSGLNMAMQRQAYDGLGGDLSPEALAKVQQDTRSAYAARGLYDSNQAIGAEILNTNAARDARMEKAQNLAMGVDSQAQQQIQSARGYGTQVAGQVQNRNQFNTGLASDTDRVNASFELQNRQQNVNNLFGLTQNYASTSIDPAQAILGRSSGSIGQTAQSMTMGQAGVQSQPGLFDPFDQQIMGIYSGNQATDLALKTTAMNNRAAVTGAAIGAVGSIAGGAL